MTQDEMIAVISHGAGCTLAHAKETLNDLFGEMAIHLAAGHQVRLPGVGTLSRVATPEREGRNPATGETIHIRAGHKIKFSASAAMKARLADVR